MFLNISWDKSLATCHANLIQWSDSGLQKLNGHHAMHHKHHVMFEILVRNLNNQLHRFGYCVLNNEEIMMNNRQVVRFEGCKIGNPRKW